MMKSVQTSTAQKQDSKPLRYENLPQITCPECGGTEFMNGVQAFGMPVSHPRNNSEEPKIFHYPIYVCLNPKCNHKFGVRTRFQEMMQNT